jgi:hypothetical protein
MVAMATWDVVREVHTEAKETAEHIIQQSITRYNKVSRNRLESPGGGGLEV